MQIIKLRRVGQFELEKVGQFPLELPGGKPKSKMVDR